MMERITYIDLLKGIAIILVVMGHMFEPYTDWLDSPINQMIYSVHMPLFIFLSGFVFHVYDGKRGWLKTIIKRAFALLLPFYSFSALYCYTKGLLYTDMLVMNEMHYGYWFTLVLFEIFAISLFVDVLVRNIVHWGGQKYEVYIDVIINIIMILALLAVAKIESIPSPYDSLFSTDKVCKYYMFFQMGRFIHTYPKLSCMFKKQWLYLLCITTYFILFLHYGYELQSVNIISFILPICGIVVITNVVERNQKVLEFHGILSKIGKYSLEIYLIHRFLLTNIPHGIIDCYGIIYIQVIVLFALSMACIIMSLLIAKLIHHSDFLNFVLLGKGIYLKQIANKWF